MSTHRASSEAIAEIVERHKNDYQFGDNALHGAIASAVRDALAAFNLKPDIAYMEVPRCDQCRYWRPAKYSIPTQAHECVRQDFEHAKFEVSISGGVPIVTEADFGCVQFDAKEGE